MTLSIFRVIIGLSASTSVSNEELSAGSWPLVNTLDKSEMSLRKDEATNLSVLYIKQCYSESIVTPDSHQRSILATICRIAMNVLLSCILDSLCYLLLSER